MDLQIALDHRTEAEEFQRKHRIGLLTLLFTDIAGSAQIKQSLGDRRAFALFDRHRALVRELLGRFPESELIGTAGDSFFIVFAKPSDAVKFSLLLQSRLGAMASDLPQPIHDRIGIHVGEVFVAEDEDRSKELYGLQVDICARVLALGRPHLVMMTRFAFDSARQILRGQDLEGVGTLSWVNHGLYQLKGVEEAMEICAVAEEVKGPHSPPASSDKACRCDPLGAGPGLGWRPAADQIVPDTHWILEQKLGAGGFGEVWLACHGKLGERRVIKFCFRPERVRSLKREVTLFRVIKERFEHHPRIVSIREVCFEKPPYYLVMDYAGGLDLRDWCSERGGLKKIPRSTLIEIAAQVAEALQAAHEVGVIHRDVKPSNILLNGTSVQPADISVKLTDFGIGHVVSPEILKGRTQAGFTQTNSPDDSTNAGTHLYMAPELLANKPASTRSDIFSLGVVLFQMLVGDFTQPLTVDWADEIDDPLLRHDLARCFAGNPLKRWSHGIQLAESLRQLNQRRLEGAACGGEAGDAVATNVESSANPGALRNIPHRDLHLKSNLIDLSRFYNAALDEDWYGEPGGNLDTLPRGRTALFAGIPFDSRGLIQLSSQTANATRRGLPERVRGIPLTRKCRRLHFLHAALCLESDGTPIGSYIVHFTDGQQREVPIVYGYDLREWCFDYDPVRELRRAVVAWTGRNAGRHPVRLYKYSWDNPLPDTNLLSMDFVSAMTDAAPFLIAITSE